MIAAPYLGMASRKVIGHIIRVERKKRGLSQEALAELSGLSRTHIGEIERGEVRVSFDALANTATGLGIPLSDLIRLYEDRTAGKG